MLLNSIVFTVFLLLDDASSFVAIRQCWYRIPHTIKLCKTSHRHRHQHYQHQHRCTWSPQDLTTDNTGYQPIPEDDYVKKYQKNPELWPVEFFVIAYRRIKNKETQLYETQVLVRRSANGTSLNGLGTGVPITRWVLSQANAPDGFEFRDITFDARWYPEYPKNREEESWKYRKIDLKEDSFTDNRFEDNDLKTYAAKVRDALRDHLLEMIQQNGDATLSSWELSTASIVKKILDNPNSVAALQGSFRMSGLFEKKDQESIEESDDESATTTAERYMSFDDAPGPSQLAKSMRIYTMFPQMPDPMPLPSTSAKDLQHEIATRGDRMAKNGRDPHKDKYGRRYTHISTSNVSNTIHGVYITVDVSNIDGLDDMHGLDLFGTTTKVDREWVSLKDLKVLNKDGRTIGTEDTKSTFISGFIVRQLVKEGVIPR